MHFGFPFSTELMGSGAFLILGRWSLGATVQLEVKAQGTRLEVVSAFKVFLYTINLPTAFLKQDQLGENPPLFFFGFGTFPWVRMGIVKYLRTIAKVLIPPVSLIESQRTVAHMVVNLLQERMLDLGSTAYQMMPCQPFEVSLRKLGWKT